MRNRDANADARPQRVRGILREAYRFFKTSPYAISVIWKFQPKLLAILAFSTVLDGVSPTATVWVGRYFLDALVNAFQQQGRAEPVKKALCMLALQLGVTLGLACTSKVMAYITGVLAGRVSLKMQSDLIDGMSCLEMKDYDNPELHDMIERARNEAQNNKPLIIVSGVCGILSSVITWLLFSIVLFRFSSVVIVAMLALCVPYLVLNLYYGKANFNLRYGRAQEQRSANYFYSCFTDRRSLPEIITRNLWSFLKSKWMALTTKFIRQDNAMVGRRTAAELLIAVFTYIGRGGVSFYILLKCLQHFANYTVGQIVMYYQSFSGGVTALTQVMQQLSAVYEGSCYLQTYQQFFDAQKTSRSLHKVRREVPKIIESIECRALGFKYPGASTYALQDVNVVFAKGRSTLLVGRNGAGKTTLARLLVGLYRPTEGQILINGYDMREYDVTLLRERMSIIFQDFVRHALTAEENIGLGSIEHLRDHQRIVEAAKAAQLDGIIARLPKGYATMLGKEFPDGADLSLGEWQRICLARLFMRRASVMLYDEPSASLDIETESELLREIGSLGKNAICILISHRMLRADIAERILVIERGRIVEDGTHSALVTLGGRYAHLWRTYHSLDANTERHYDANAMAL